VSTAKKKNVGNSKGKEGKMPGKLTKRGKGKQQKTNDTNPTMARQAEAGAHHIGEQAIEKTNQEKKGR